MKGKGLLLVVLFAVVSGVKGASSKAHVTVCSKVLLEDMVREEVPAEKMERAINGYVVAMMEELGGQSIPEEGVRHHLGKICEEVLKQVHGKVCPWFPADQIKEREGVVVAMVDRLLPKILVSKEE